MNRDPENFDSLRRLLAWKRHEQPPPGYFNDFSRRVLARIEAGERGEDAASWRTWLPRLWVALEARPVFAGAFGAAVCAFLAMGLFSSEPAPVVTFKPAPETTMAVSGPAPSPGGFMPVANTNTNELLHGLFRENFLQSREVNSSFDLSGGR